MATCWTPTPSTSIKPRSLVFYYNEMEGGVVDHGGQDKVEEADEGAYQQVQAKKVEHCWYMLKDRDKWKLIDEESLSKRGSLTNMDEDEDDDDPRNLNKPDGDNKTKEKIKREHEASSLRGKIDAMVQTNELTLAKSLETKIELAEKKAREKQER
ncbi:hypothetical protein D1007_51209 [Hordeum vulgare]|nr:hypothetical protein D1007_51209 [Hordeum vulgare]